MKFPQIYHHIKTLPPNKKIEFKISKSDNKLKDITLDFSPVKMTKIDENIN